MSRSPTQRPRRGLPTLLALAALAAGATPALGATEVPRVSISRLAAAGATLSVAGRVEPAPETAAQRHRCRVLLRLSGASGLPESRTVKLTAGDGFSARWTTRLTGSLNLTAQAELSGRPVGEVARRTVNVASTRSRTGAGAGARAVSLVGLFKLDRGAAPAGQAPTGSYFELLTSGGAPFPNLTSTGGNKDETPLTPGLDGGLETGAYQPAPTPAFAGLLGGARAGDIIEPTSFNGSAISVDTNPIDPQTRSGDPAPAITDTGGRLTGQVTAWVAQWSGESLNQGTPKPAGGTPAPTTAVSGTYDPTTGHFTLDWTSRITGGLLNGFAGRWHLSGTFIPASELGA